MVKKKKKNYFELPQYHLFPREINASVTLHSNSKALISPLLIRALPLVTLLWRYLNETGSYQCSWRTGRVCMCVCIQVSCLLTGFLRELAMKLPTPCEVMGCWQCLVFPASPSRGSSAVRWGSWHYGWISVWSGVIGLEGFGQLPLKIEDVKFGGWVKLWVLLIFPFLLGSRLCTSKITHHSAQMRKWNFSEYFVLMKSLQICD